MGDIFSGICTECLQPVWGFLTAHANYISKFEDNLDDLNSALDDLKAKRDDVLCRIDVEELKGGKRLAVVTRWLSKVKTIETNTNQLVAVASPIRERLSTHCFCSNNIISTYCCGKKIPKMLDKVDNLLSKGDFEVVAVPGPPPVVEDNLVQQTFGLDTKLNSTWSLLMEEDTRMLGLYGMGGVGKTTLLTLIKSKFVNVKNNFDVVIWVIVSKDVDIGKIQDDTGKRLGLYDENWSKKLQTEKAGDIHGVLKDRDVCGSMGANKDIEVQCLAENDAWDLFKLKARCGGLSEEISGIAKKIAANCCGLPLALGVIGKTLASKTTVDEWRRALSTLESSPSACKGTEKGIFQVLKLSYDNLEKKDAKLCFQYCALFPKAYNIKQDEMVEYWIGEGIIDEKHGRQRAKDLGCEIIDTLVEASLLLKDGESKQKVYMHDMIREMALWIVSEIRDGERFVVKTNAGLSELPKGADWKTVTKMSLMNNEIESIHDDPQFPAPALLITLFLQKNNLVNIVGRFFVVMSTLVVLDLSRNLGITELPEEISTLVSLRYLNLLGTLIKELPDRLRDLIKLIHLDLESTSNLQSISLISELLNLQVLRFYGSAPLDRSLLENLEVLNDLELLTITVREFDVLEAFLRSKLAECTQGLYLQGLEISGVPGKSFAATYGALGSLSKLGMTECDIIESETEWEENRWHQYSSPSPSSQRSPSNIWFKNLSAVVLISCEHLKDLTWLIYAANLESLSVKISPKLEQVISETKAAGVVGVEPFLKLQVLDLEYLGALKSIYWRPLSFPRLKNVHITNCSKLRKLPFNFTSVEKIDDLIIEVDDGWINRFEWESGTENRFRHAIRQASVSQFHLV